ncbi:MAG: hypothetical protein ABEJ56_04235 [Candidatus Nanohaloarchaea archaeon]
MKCKVCGRTKQELEEEFGNEIEIMEHQEIDKCSKCVREYQAETQGDREVEEMEDKNWKEQILA